MQIATGACQRWNQGREHYRSAANEAAFSRLRYSVEVIDEARARAFCVEHHYSRSYPAAVVRVGLFGPGARLVGAAVFSVSMNPRVVPHHCGVEPSAGLELGRFVLLDECPANSETAFLRGAFDALRQVRPHTRAIVSYSDPMPRRTAQGRLLLPGHVGIIYQAHNGRYLGRGAARKLHLMPDGRVLSPRTISKIRLGECGWEAGQRFLEAHGAPARGFGESGAAWVDRVLATGLFRCLRHPGNHVYVWALGDRRERRQVQAGFVNGLPFPKQVDAEAA